MKYNRKFVGVTLTALMTERRKNYGKKAVKPYMRRSACPRMS